MSMKAAELRLDLLARADTKRAGDVCNQLVDLALDRFNDANTSVATSLLARALFARAMIDVAAAWWADYQQLEPETFKAIMSIVQDIPPIFEQKTWLKDER